jgi:Guanosine polyphosphate pyrophosphohydrolases/synthetases
VLPGARLLHGRYQVLPQRFKDYISVPKPNGYRSLHTGVIGPLGQRIEIQIRTEEMQDQAERGVAAHWIYKQGGPSTDAPQYAWLRSLIEILDKAPNAEDSSSTPSSRCSRTRCSASRPRAS